MIAKPTPRTHAAPEVPPPSLCVACMPRCSGCVACAGDDLRSYRQGAVDALASLLEGLRAHHAEAWCERGGCETFRFVISVTEDLIGTFEDLMPRDETGRPM